MPKTGGLADQVMWLGLRIGGRLALLYIHHMNRVNSRNDLVMMKHYKYRRGYYYYYYYYYFQYRSSLQASLSLAGYCRHISYIGCRIACAFVSPPAFSQRVACLTFCIHARCTSDWPCTSGLDGIYTVVRSGLSAMFYSIYIYEPSMNQYKIIFRNKPVK